jgi:phosphoglycolate phosphatase-like HAD superfamily hydrolase
MYCQRSSNSKVLWILIIGLDFDQTVADTADAVRFSLKAVCQDYGLRVDDSELQLMSRSGKPLAEIFGAFGIYGNDSVEKFKYHYLKIGLAKTKFCFGAQTFLEQAELLGIIPVIISAKTQINLTHSMNFLGLSHLKAYGELHGYQKTVKLIECSVQIYAGDQVSDVIAANNAGILSVYIGTELNPKHEIEIPNFIFNNMLEFSLELPKILKR